MGGPFQPRIRVPGPGRGSRLMDLTDWRACKLVVCIQLFADGLRELVRPEWFGEKIDTFLQWKIPAGQFDAVTAGVNHFQFWIFFQKPFGQILSRHTAGHDHVRHQKINSIAVLFPDFQSFAAADRFEHVIAKLQQGFVHGRAQCPLVFNEQNRFLAAAHGGQHGLPGFLAGLRGQTWKINAEDRPAADFAVNIDPALVLLRNAKNGGQPEAGALADILGGEERLENSRKNFRRDAATGITHAQTHERTGTGKR